jgi:AcrR family transcriptional regulator
MKLRDSEATRRALKAAGMDLFARRGFSGATADRIARKAGVNKAMINYHFGGKRGLYTAILRETFAELVSRLHGLTESPEAPLEKMRAFIGIIAGLIAHAPDLPAMLMRELVSGGEHIEQEVVGFIQVVFGTVKGIVDEGVRERVFRPVDPLLTHLTLIGSLVFFLATEEFRQRALAASRLPLAPPTTAQFVAHLQELMACGLALVDAPARSTRER